LENQIESQIKAGLRTLNHLTGESTLALGTVPNVTDEQAAAASLWPALVARCSKWQSFAAT